MANEADNKNVDIIDLRKIIKQIIARKKLFYKTLPIAFVLSCAYILCIPRYYSTTISLAPEMESSGMGGALGSIASSFGFDFSSLESTDAISPLLYPDLMEDNGFVSKFFSIPVKSIDGDIDCTYYEYLDKHQKHPWWKTPIGWIKSLFDTKSLSTGAKEELDPYRLSKKQNDVVESMRDKITISVDKKTAVISISVQAQDPLICKTMTDSVKEKLQQFITEYRTNKARIDLEYYTQLTKEAKEEYTKSRQTYGAYSDANMDITLESFIAKKNDLENEMQLKYNAYATLNTQLQAAKAKVQERTPAFTIIKGADVPIKPAGPKRMLFVLGIVMLTFCVDVMIIMRKDIINKINS
ncbi:MAG: chain-length determining protein [Prevotella sp.]|nr:chain-length determining protein [Prevotella sp.]